MMDWFFQVIFSGIINATSLLNCNTQRNSSMEKKMINQRKEKHQVQVILHFLFRHCNDPCVIKLFNMGSALQLFYCQYLLHVNKQCWHLFELICHPLMASIESYCNNWTGRFEQFSLYLPRCKHDRDSGTLVSRTWLWVQLMGSWPQCSIVRQEVNESLEEVLHSYPLQVPWHPQEASTKLSRAKSITPQITSQWERVHSFFFQSPWKAAVIVKF